MRRRFRVRDTFRARVESAHPNDQTTLEKREKRAVPRKRRRSRFRKFATGNARREGFSGKGRKSSKPRLGSRVDGGRARTSTVPWACIPSECIPRGPPWSAARRRCRAPRPWRRRASPGDGAGPPRRSFGGAHRLAGTNLCAPCAPGARSMRTRHCSCSPGREFEPRGRRRWACDERALGRT